MSILSSLLKAGTSLVKVTAKGVLIVTRVAMVRTVTTSAAVAASVVDEVKIAAGQLKADPNVKAGIEAGKTAYVTGSAFARNKAAALEAAATDFADRHR